MTKEEFIQKMNEIKRQMQEILWKVEGHDAYIYQEKRFYAFHSQIEEHINDIAHILKNSKDRNTSEVFHDSVYKEFSGYLELDKNMWNEYKQYKWIGSKAVKDGEEYYRW